MVRLRNEVVAYSIKTYGVSLCVKRFDALIKNVCNAGACVLTYWWATTVTHKLPGIYVNRAVYSTPGGVRGWLAAKL